jgi:hypothetical protein
VHHRTDTRPVDHRSTRRHVSPTAAVGSIALIAALLLTTSACGSGASPAAAGTSRADGGDPTPAARGATALDPCTILPTTGLARLVDARLSQRGPAEERALGQQCSWDFPDPGGVVDGALTITAWRGDQFFSAGSIGEPLPGLGDEAQIDRASGIVLFRVGDDVLQAHLLSPARHGRALDVARALAGAL